MTLTDVFRWCGIRAAKVGLSANGRSLLFALMQAWNNHGRPSSFKITVKGIRGLSMLNERTFSRCVQVLNSKNCLFHLKVNSGVHTATVWTTDDDRVADACGLSIAGARTEEELKGKKAATRPFTPTSKRTETSTSSSPKQSIAGELISLDAKKARSLRQNKYSRSSQCGINFFL